LVRRALAVVVLAAAWAAAHADEAEGRASVGVSAERTVVYAGEPVRLTIRVAYDAEFLAAQGVPLFSRKTDAPLHVQAAWLRAIRGMEPVASPEPEGPSATIAFGDDIVRAARGVGEVSDGRPRATLTVTRAFVAREPGEVALDAPELRFAYATKFEDDFVDGRRGIDRRDVVVRGEAVALRVLALPPEGRPATFTGAVGRSLSIQADSSRREVTAGETFRLTLRIEGDGHLASFDAPRLDGLAGFHVYGVLDDHGARERTIAYDVAALDARVREVPSIEWSYFDTSDPPSYRTLRTTPIPLTVRAAAGTPSAGTSPPATEEGASAELWAAIAAGVTALVAAIAWIASRRRSVSTLDPGDARRAAAADAVRAATATPGADAGAAFTEYLAARLHCAPPAVVGSDLAARLAAAGVAGDLAARAAAAFDALVASRYGGTGAPDGPTIVAIVDAMESQPAATTP
jgi:hypothetical protein